MMKYLQIPGSDLKPSNIIMGCMRINNLDKKGAEQLIRTAMEAGVNMFDHADIYGDGYCEEFFAEAVGMNPQVREKMILQSKCGIRKGYYDFSKEHILEAVDGSLKRLHTDYLDVLLLHRPDALMEPEEVAEAFHRLESQGKVLHFLLAQKGDVFQKDVEEEYSLRPSSATQLLQKMEQDGLIRRESLPGDARRKRIVVCPKGLAYKAAVMEDIRTLEAQLTKGIDPDDLETFLRVMEQMLKNIP